jgi:hypothetical protein
VQGALSSQLLCLISISTGCPFMTAGKADFVTMWKDFVEKLDILAL